VNSAVAACRSCAALLTVSVVDLGEQPLANSYLRPDSVDEERSYPLHARLCEHCGLVQVDDVVQAEEIFGDYAYFSSVSEGWVEHARRYSASAIDRLGLGPRDLVVEVASNDGYLLQWFVQSGIRIVGIEPASNIAEFANERGVPTLDEFFGLKVAGEVREQFGPASLIVANNVLAHVPDLNDFVAGLAALIADDGMISIEVPHLLNLVSQTQFDTIYHEHYSYFSLIAAAEVLGRHGLQVHDVEGLPTHGGSLRIWARRSRQGLDAAGSVDEVMRAEREARIDRAEGFIDFAGRVSACRQGLLEFLDRSKGADRTVVAYGAAAKGNTLLNYCGIGVDQIPYVADRSPHKQGLLLPGSHLPIVDPGRILEDRPDRVLVLPWNLSEEISRQMSEVANWGGSFVTAVPEVRVLR
jgi:2-polyprenyl-3-methyl-5-hydroxy-6-metoxy-1,4-benzoquinol methylase